MTDMASDTQGMRIKKIRKFRSLTQRGLSDALGLGSAGDIRIAQYEKGSRHPKSDMLLRIAEMLDVNPAALDSPVGCSIEEFMQSLFWAEEFIGSAVVRECFKEWSSMRMKMECGEISKTEYFNWKLTWTELAKASFSARNQSHEEY